MICPFDFKKTAVKPQEVCPDFCFFLHIFPLSDENHFPLMQFFLFAEMILPYVLVIYYSSIFASDLKASLASVMSLSSSFLLQMSTKSRST